MNKEKIAILTDSCCDVPKTYQEKYQIYVLPLKVIYKGRGQDYLDGVTITPQEVYDSLKEEIPTTSLPDGKSVLEVFDQIKKDGYKKVLVITLSSGLSGANNMMHVLKDEIKDLEIAIIDTKNIAIGGGFHAIQAAKYIEKGYDFQTIVEKTERNIKNSKIYFIVETLEYLQKGGRIGLVASILGNALNLKPIISCNDEGIYYTVAKVRGRKHSISKAIDLAEKRMALYDHYDIAICHGAAEVEAEDVKKELLPKATHIQEYMEGQISPALGVHTGPGLIGIGVFSAEE